LGQNLTPVASAHGLDELRLPQSVRVIILESPMLVEGALSSLLQPIDLNEEAVLVVSLDAEWNISHQTGVSILQIAPPSCPNEIYIIPVCSLSFSSLLYLYD
jgi:hypothetical protein